LLILIESAICGQESKFDRTKFRFLRNTFFDLINAQFLNDFKQLFDFRFVNVSKIESKDEEIHYFHIHKNVFVIPKDKCLKYKFHDYSSHPLY
jgi:hypothetical protein